MNSPHLEESGATLSSSNVQSFRQRVHVTLPEASATRGYGADRIVMVKLLNGALATEMVCMLRYKRHYFMARGPHSEAVKTEFRLHIDEKMLHADRLAKRIVELGGEPDFSPDGLSARSHAEYAEGTTLRSMIRENLIAERIAIESYREMIDYLGAQDPTTLRMLKEILATEKGHANALSSLMEKISAAHGGALPIK